MRFFKVQVVQLCSSTDAAAGWKDYRFILLQRSYFYMVGNHRGMNDLLYIDQHILKGKNKERKIWPLSTGKRTT